MLTKYLIYIALFLVATFAILRFIWSWMLPILLLAAAGWWLFQRKGKK